ncbi:MAG: STAS domain-containing protein [Candidatus Nanopelagicales bacterium]
MEARIPTPHNVATALNVACVISEEWIGHTVVVRASGVLDMLTSPQLEAGIATALEKNPSAIIVDLNDVDFLASAGMSVLVAARDHAAPAVKFAVVANGPATSRPLKMVGLADLIGLYPTLDEASAALGA